ncbi:hypothetical protein INT47_010563 [Mucor saturninus]|uniref:Exportin-1 n=1 Tax=Mucor saturninus TaxID=64648 RepID=A0A8H7QUT5_9FUNG|nr:hypothetical protein INT47_010563 [Mucor saturninus]
MNSLISSPFDIKTFDKTVQSFYEGDNVTRQKAQAVLTEFQRNPDSWQLVDQILEHSTSPQAKFIALGILEDFIIVRWNTLPMEQRLAMRNYIVKSIIDLSSNELTLRSEKTYINKLDLVLVQILKKDWPQYWPSFIQEIVDSSLVNTSLCENNMKILKLLSEEVFDFSVDHMTMAKMQKLKNQMVNEFGSIFDLCKKVLLTHTVAATHLVQATLETLLKFISWIPIQFVYQQDLVQILESNLAGSPMQRNLSLQCFTEMIQLEIVDQQYNDVILNIYTIVIREMTRIIPSNVDIAQFYEISCNEDQHFIEALAIFLSTFLAKYRLLVEKTHWGQESVHKTLHYLLKLSRVHEREIWKICLECWGKLTYDVVQDMNHNQVTPYEDILKQLGIVLIENMVKPDDVFVIENDDGEITRGFVKQSDTTVLSKSMRDVFNSLTNIYPAYIQNLIQEKLAHVFTSKVWSWDELFRVCWTVGSISGAISEQKENQFLESILAKDLVQLLQKEERVNPNSDQEWVVASCLLYIAGQYVRFLKSHWDLLSFLLQKIFIYMQHDQVSVRDMACDSFLKICQGCRQDLSIPRGDRQSVLESLLIDLGSMTARLDSSQLCTFYKAIGSIISESPTGTQHQSVSLLMAIPNETIAQALHNPTTPSALKIIINVLKVNVVTCESIGPIFRTQLQIATPILIQCYRISSRQPKEQLHKRIRQLILELLETFVISNECLELQDQTMLSELIQVILIDYKGTINENRDPRVLSLLTSMFEKMQDPIWPDLLKETIGIEFEYTLPMITSNFVDYPEFQLFQSSELFQLVIDSIMWGTKHTIREISQIALQTCLDMINAVAQLEDEDISCQFFETYYVRILRDILEVLVDPDCRNGFNYQSQVLSRLFELVQEGEIYTRLFNPNEVSNPLMSNTEFLQQYTLELLCTAFPLLQKDQIEVLVMGMFEYSGDLQRFQNDIRDFLIDIREVGENNIGQQRAQEEINAELELLRDL